jgi:asparagine synthase (glutamine-hydrolysing)
VSNDLRETIDDLLVGGRLADTGFMDKRELQRLVEDQQRGRRDESKQLWQLLTLGDVVPRHARPGVSGL